MPRSIKFLAIFFLLNTSGYSQSVLSTGSWYKMQVTERGIYKLSYDYLRNAGIDVDNIDPRTIKIYGYRGGMLPQSNAVERPFDLTEISIKVEGEEDNQFNAEDYILFYGEDGDDFEYSDGVLSYEHNIYSDENYYFITFGGANGERITTITNEPGDYPRISTFNDFRFYKREAFNLLTSGRNWYSERFNTTISQSYSFNFPNIVSSSEIKVTAKVMAQSFEASSFDIGVNGTIVGSIPVERVPDFTQRIFRYSIKGRENILTFTRSSSTTSNGNVKISVDYNKNGAQSIGYLDYLLVETESDLSLNNGVVNFRSLESLSNVISNFEISGTNTNTQVWNVTNHDAVEHQETVSTNNRINFNRNSSEIQEYIAFNIESLNEPSAIVSLSNQDLKANLDAEFIIITHPSFQSEAVRLANFRMRNDNLVSKVVNIQKVYNEFSSGRQDVTAIRDFAKYLYDNGQLKYLLLFGRGSYDYKDVITNNTNFIPIYESRNSLDPLDTYASDDYFGFLEDDEGEWEEINGGNHSMDIGVGRLPIKSIEEARSVVDKIMHYASNEQTIGDWRNNVIFVADDGDRNLHQEQANELAQFLDTTYTAFQSGKFFLDNFQQISRPSGEVSPKASESLDQIVEEGALIVNFTGHGGESGWMQEQVLDIVQIQNWKNIDRLPLFVTATCEFGRHDDPRRISGGELVVTNPLGGGIAIVSTCRPVSSASNFELNKAFYDNAYLRDANNEYLRLGDIFRLTKNQSVNLARDGNRVGNRNFALLGDPTVRLSYPSKNIEITEINGILDKQDTLKALDNVQLNGQIKNANGTFDAGFNGEVSFVIYDKEIFKTTLGNENSPFTYKSKENILFKGTSSVSNGEFDISFIVPKNISYEIGSGKINMYAFSDTMEDANGSDINLTIGGTSNNLSQDNIGPDIQLFMGDTLNTNLSNVSHNTNLVAILSDESGINLSSFGIGNNITATLDGEEVFILNEYYSAFKDTFKKGYLSFPLRDLTQGKHTIVLKAWDTNNNSSEATIDFTVADPNKVVIYRVENYPNPFVENTNFRFTHNRAGDDLKVEFSISSPIGGEVFSTVIEVKNSASDVELLQWDGNSLQGQKLKAGVYMYSISVRSIRDGAKNSAFQKLILIN